MIEPTSVQDSLQLRLGPLRELGIHLCIKPLAFGLHFPLSCGTIQYHTPMTTTRDAVCGIVLISPENPVENRVRKRDEQMSDPEGLLLDLTYDVSLAADIQGALSTLAERLSGLMPCDGIAVMWLDGDQLEVRSRQGSTAPLRGLTLPASQVGAAQAALDGGRPVLVSDTAKDPNWKQIPGEEHVRAWLGVPLQVDNWTLGLLEWTALEAARFGEDEATTAAEIARSIAPILHQAQLLEDARLRLREYMEPHLSATSRTVDLSAELEPVVREALEFADARHAFVFLLENGNHRLRCVAASGDRHKQISNITLRGDGTLGGWRIPMAQSSERLGAGPSDREVMAELGIGRTLILPLRVRGEQAGMLGVAEPRHGRAFGRDNIRVMTQLASQASVIVERVYQQIPARESFDYESVFHSSPLGVGVLTITGEIRLCNRALASLLGRSDRSLVGQSLSGLLVPSDGRRVLRTLEEVSISGKRRQVDARLRVTAGEDRHVRINLSQVHVPDDAGGNLVAIIEDVTSLKILERERVEHLHQLGEKHAQLEELDQVKSRFVSNVSHELRTPLAVIKLYATLARKGRPEKQTHYLQTIEQETQRLETMVENILDLTRMDRHALRVNPELLAAEEIIAQVLQVYQEKAQRQAIDLRNHVQGRLPRLWADKNHLIQMLTNLVDNALKYTHRGGQVWVAAREIGSDSKRMLEIAVGDTGVGIPQDEQQRVFERFYRGSNNTPGSTGTGLGLAIVQELMVQHGGQVMLRSREGEGSVFALQFPLYEGGSPEDARDDDGDE
jgi:PAS domain S-box-containing protein